MLLSARILCDVGSVNSFGYATAAKMTAGDATTIYIQLIDASADTEAKGFSPPGRRFMPAADATLQVVLQSIDDAKQVTRYATQPYDNDPSIWAISVLSTDTIRGTVNIKLTLTEDAVVTRGYLAAGLLISSQG